ncbi:MAG TPA: hypothetical protein VK003_07710 [Oceanobacillus sp.]|nr:hypothetical protein [Oceanobacillus sp.]
MSERIIVFNHSPNHLLLYKTILNAHGYEVFTYQQDMADFREVEAIQPRLIILGNVTGTYDDELDIVGEIRAHAQTHETPILIVTTAATHMLNYERIRAFGNIYTMTKPFDALQLLLAVKQALGSSEDVTSH